MIYKTISTKFKDIIHNDLNVTPIDNYATNPVKFPVYEINDDKIYIPKFWKHESITDYNIGKKKESKLINIKFNGTLRDEQNNIVYDVMNSLKKKNGIILSLPCGFGKTVLAINMISKLKLKTLVIVHKTFLLEQWKERIQSFTDARIGTIRQKVVDIHDKDIVIGMLQSISAKKYSEDIFNEFDLVIVDEVHNIATKMFSKALLKLRCTYSIGLSATPNRKDGLSKVYQWFLGTDVYSLPTNEKKTIKLDTHKYKNQSETEKKLFIEKKLYNGKINLAAIVTNISMSLKRNEFIMSLIPVDSNRNTLILSSRISQLEWLLTKFTELYPNISSSLYIGRMKPFELKEAENAQVLFATYEMVSEGFDLPKLNCIVFATPRTEIEQSVGRILRKQHDNVTPLIIDICDVDIGIFIAQYKKRMNFYKKKYIISSTYNHHS